MQRAAGKRFVGFPDSSHDQRGERLHIYNKKDVLRFPLWKPQKEAEKLLSRNKQAAGDT